MQFKLHDGTKVNLFPLDKKPKSVNSETQALMITYVTEVELPDVVEWHDQCLSNAVYLAHDVVTPGKFSWIESSPEYRETLINLLTSRKLLSKWLWVLVTKSDIPIEKQIINIEKLIEKSGGRNK